MAGSKLWFAYTDDNGSVWGLNADESNVKALNGSTGRPLPAGLVDAVPRNVKVRYAVYEDVGATRRLRIPVLTPGLFNTIETTAATIPDPLDTSGTPVNLTFGDKKAERRRTIRRRDTGQIDGTDDT